MASIAFTGQSAAAAPPSTGFHSAKPIKGMEWIDSDFEQQAVGYLRVQVVCPADDGHEYAISASAAGLSNYGRFGRDPGEVVDCTGRPQIVSVTVWDVYYGWCRVEPGTYGATATLGRVNPNAGWDDPPSQALDTVTTTIKISKPSPTGENCSILE